VRRRNMLPTEEQDIQCNEKPCQLVAIFEGENQGAPVHPPDLSTLGMFINTREDLSVGAVLNLNFRLLLSEVEVGVRAQVRRTMPGVGVGVEFLDLSPIAKRAIEQELELAYPNGDLDHFEEDRIPGRRLSRQRWANWFRRRRETSLP
jgi:PilZ domain-containing protein